MALDRKRIGQTVSLGANGWDKLRLFFFALMAPAQDGPQGRLRRKFGSLIPEIRVKPKQLNGAQLSINPNDWSQTVIFEEVFINNNYDLDKVKFIPDLIIDCGAHIGMFSLLARCKFPKARMVSYEPNPQNVGWVRRQIARNKLDIQLFDCAVSTEAKTFNFAWGNSHSGRLIHEASNGTHYQVSAIDFPQAVKDLHPQSLLLKMDVEGEEELILPKLMPFLPQKSAMFFETHAGDDGWRKIEMLLKANGFQVEQINSRGLFCDGFAWRG
jgi:FkbM family methyltransferase